ncbi:MAG: hypothetical protein QNJ98_00675 [Planctomycetota bacterium]|nr:hypothetical protein [Planctomycetota bacterium]
MEGAHTREDVTVLGADTGPTAAARNAALADVTTPWTAFLDPRDRWAPEYLASQLAVLDAEPDADLVVAGCRYVGDAGGLYATSFDRPDWRTPSSIEALCGGAFAHLSAVVVRTATAQAVRFDEGLEAASTLDWLFQVVAGGARVVENPATLVEYGERAEPDDELRALEADEVRARYAAACPACARDALDLIRRRARYLARVGRRREARPWFWRWWKKKPDSTQALGGLLKCLFARK